MRAGLSESLIMTGSLTWGPTAPQCTTSVNRSHQNDISMIWSMDSVVAAFDKELEEYSQLKINARTKVSEQLKVFNNKFETVDPVQISKPEAIN